MPKHGTKTNRPSAFARAGRAIAAFFTTNRPSRGKAIALVSVLAVFGILFVSLGSVMVSFAYRREIIRDLPDESLGIDTSADAGKSKDITNIALFGLGSRSKTINRGLTDSIMVVSVDRLHNKIKVISVMRDSLVPIEGYRAQKINAAYVLGGAKLAIRTLNQAFGLNIRDYATVNFLGMAEIIDVMGGIEVDLTERERKDANIHIRSAAKEVGAEYTPIEKAGKQVLNGAQAVAFARIRHVSTADGVSNDFGRTDRQRYVMEQMFNKALKMNPSEYPKLIKTLLKYVETSLSYEDVIGMAGVLTGGVKFEQTRVPLVDYVINAGYSVRGSSTVYFNLDYAKKIVNAFIYDDIDPEDYIRENGVDKSGWYSGNDYANQTKRTTTAATTAPSSSSRPSPGTQTTAPVPTETEPLPTDPPLPESSDGSTVETTASTESEPDTPTSTAPAPPPTTVAAEPPAENG